MVDQTFLHQISMKKLFHRHADRSAFSGEVASSRGAMLASQRLSFEFRGWPLCQEEFRAEFEKELQAETHVVFFSNEY